MPSEQITKEVTNQLQSEGRLRMKIMTTLIGHVVDKDLAISIKFLILGIAISALLFSALITFAIMNLIYALSTGSSMNFAFYLVSSVIIGIILLSTLFFFGRQAIEQNTLNEKVLTFRRLADTKDAGQ